MTVQNRISKLEEEIRSREIGPKHIIIVPCGLGMTEDEAINKKLEEEGLSHLKHNDPDLKIILLQPYG